MTTHTPFGYKVENGKIVIDDEEALVLRKLFEVYLECGSLLAAARELKIKKTHSVIGRLISNKKYLGTDYYPRIIDDELFTKANEMKQQKALRTNRYKTKEIKVEEECHMQFNLNKVDLKFEDPYQQAEYAFSLIKEVVGE